MFLARRSLDLIRQTKLIPIVSLNHDNSRLFSLSALADPDMFLPLLAAGTIACGGVAFTISRYRISKPNEYLVRTGLGISDMLVTKHGYQWPLQIYQFVDMKISTFSFNLQAMSSEKMEFILPGVFTIGPKNDIEAIKRFARLLSSDEYRYGFYTLVKGIFEGETRLQSAQMTLEQIFNDRKAFKEILINNVQEELDQFGLEIYNANIKELQDSAGNKYFSFLRQKKRSESENRAKIDFAEAKRVGDIGEKVQEAITRQRVIEIEAETVRLENERQQDIERSKADLAVVVTEADKKTKVAKIEADNAAKIREAELQREWEQSRIAMETEKLRATDLSKVQVTNETTIKEADGIAVALCVKAAAELFAEQQKAQEILAIDIMPMPKA